MSAPRIAPLNLNPTLNLARYLCGPLFGKRREITIKNLFVGRWLIPVPRSAFRVR